MTRFSLFLLASLLVIGCTTDEPFPPLDVELNGANLPMLDPEEGQYALWMSYPDDPTSEKRSVTTHSSSEFVLIGSFVVDAAGNLQTPGGGALDFSLPDGYNPQLIFDAIISVERPGPLPNAPGSRLLAGVVEGTQQQGRADLTVGGADAFGSLFGNVERLKEARYGLITPSTESTDDENQGLWFFSGNSAPGLPLDSLTTLTENRGWTYQAWITDSSRLYSLGTFTTPDGKDSDGSGPFGGPNKDPLELPGSDYVSGTTYRLNAGGFGIVVALQPTALGLDRPFYQLFAREQIDSGTATGVPLPLPYTRTEPVVSITFSR